MVFAVSALFFSLLGNTLARTNTVIARDLLFLYYSFWERNKNLSETVFLHKFVSIWFYFQKKSLLCFEWLDSCQVNDFFSNFLLTRASFYLRFLHHVLPPKKKLLFLFGIGSLSTVLNACCGLQKYCTLSVFKVSIMYIYWGFSVTRFDYTGA